MKKNINSTPNYSAVRNVETVRKGKNYSLYDPSLHTDYARRRPGSSCIGATLLKGKKKIMVWDPHFTENRDDAFFEYVDTNNVDIEILTYKNGSQDVCELAAEDLYNNIFDLLENKDIDFTLKIYLIHYEKEWELLNQGIFLSHDRFLIADDEVYLMGTSMSSQLAGNRLFGVYRMEAPADKDIIIKTYEKYRDFTKNELYGYTISEL